jgi:hypothetical protein
MRSLVILFALTAAGGLAACTTQGTGIDSDSWECTVLAGEQYFQGYGTSQQQAEQNAMNNCQMNAPDSTNCMANTKNCIPPKGQ